MSGDVQKMPPDVEAAWRLGGWGALWGLVRSKELSSGWYACPACGGSGTVGTGDPEEERDEARCLGCKGDGHRRVCGFWVSPPVTPAWAKP